MAYPLMSVTALFVTAAMAAPPVDTQRVTGNVSTEHQPQVHAAHAVSTPPIDSCRVTGNILSHSSKGGSSLTCEFPDVSLAMRHVQRDENLCFVVGVRTVVEGDATCAVETVYGTVHMPEDTAATQLMNTLTNMWGS